MVTGLEKITIPNAWREGYPHYIAQPRLLRCCCLIVALLTLSSFLISFVYFDRQTQLITKIKPKPDLGDEWECSSIGTFYGDYSLLSSSHVPSWNLSETTNTGFVELDNERLYDFTLNYQNSSYQFKPLQPLRYYGDGYGHITWEDRSKYYISSGRARTVDNCVESFNKYSCLNLNESAILWENIRLYKFTALDWEFIGPYGRYNNKTLSWMTNLNIFHMHNWDNYNYQLFSFFITGFGANYFQGGFSLSKATGYIYTKDEPDDHNLCDVVDYGVNNQQYIWAADFYFNDSTSLGWNDISENVYAKLIVQCELISSDYCAVNLTDAFTITNANEFESGLKMIHDYRNKYDNPDMSSCSNDYCWYTTTMMLGSTLGDTCSERWKAICDSEENYFDTDGLCTTMYLSPYECTTYIKKGFLESVSLSFSTSKLVLAILLTMIGLLIKKLSKGVIEKTNGALFETEVQLENDSGTDYHKL